MTEKVHYKRNADVRLFFNNAIHISLFSLSSDFSVASSVSLLRLLFLVELTFITDQKNNLAVEHAQVRHALRDDVRAHDSFMLIICPFIHHRKMYKQRSKSNGFS